MVNFDAVTEAIEQTDWYCFIANLEDGYVAYRHHAFPEYEVTFADWDLPNGGSHIRLDDTREDYRTATKIREELDDLDDYTAQDTVGRFFDLADGYLLG